MTQSPECCEVCGFVWNDIPAEVIGARVQVAMTSSGRMLLEHPVQALIRPSAEQWSAVEYGAHMRDVMYNLRDKLIAIAVEDNPPSVPLFGTPRVDLGLYAIEEPETLALEMTLAGDLFARTFHTLPEESHGRPFLYRYPREAQRTLLWVAAQGLHEVEHHATDIRVVLGQ